MIVFYFFLFFSTNKIKVNRQDVLILAAFLCTCAVFSLMSAISLFPRDNITMLILTFNHIFFSRSNFFPRLDILSSKAKN